MTRPQAEILEIMQIIDTFGFSQMIKVAEMQIRMLTIQLLLIIQDM